MVNWALTAESFTRLEPIPIDWDIYKCV
jgi:hypothetical protein